MRMDSSISTVFGGNCRHRSGGVFCSFWGDDETTYASTIWSVRLVLCGGMSWNIGGSYTRRLENYTRLRHPELFFHIVRHTGCRHSHNFLQMCRGYPYVTQSHAERCIEKPVLLSIHVALIFFGAGGLAWAVA
ncbi:MAG: hypothetical protein LRY43_01365 [Gammaproteobacteria bacterium]|nr:hypothetical protein [Gammaproteobacteria bacterium]